MKIIKTFEDAKHLELRLGLGAVDGRMRASVGMRVSDWLIRNTDVPLDYSLGGKPKLSNLQQSYQELKKTPRKDRMAFNKARRQESNQLAPWWLQLMQYSDFPLVERMTLFWHNHFTSNFKKVRWPQLMYEQNQLFRQHAVGSFADLLHAIYKDPAMLIYLDGTKNRRKKPNENFARELLELFTLGVGHYSENDVKSAARAFTGWQFNGQPQAVFKKRLHDAGSKTFLGNTGNFNAGDIINILLDQPRTAEFLVEKFWYHFISLATPPRGLVQQWGRKFRSSGYDVNSLLLLMLNSDEFWSREHRGVLLKSPVDFTVGLLRELQLLRFRSYRNLVQTTGRLGQAVFSPPDVKGWREGKHWVNHTTFTLRMSYVEKIVDEFVEMQGMQPTRLGTQPYSALSRQLLAVPATNRSQSGNGFEDDLLAVLKDPAYQLR